jgi:hypothetical protein
VPIDVRSITTALMLAIAAFVLGPPDAARASWSEVHCDGNSWEINGWKRSQAREYAQQAAREGYEWGGGCYRLNNVDDTPRAPDSGGEGADCSGLVFKTWALRAGGANGFRFWEHEKYVHGDYSTADFWSPAAGEPFRTMSKSYRSTQVMDAFVYRNVAANEGHIGMIYHEGSGGSDTIVEAKSDADGTGIWSRDYRSSSAYRGVMRRAWTVECYPRCRRDSATARWYDERHGARGGSRW